MAATMEVTITAAAIVRCVDQVIARDENRDNVVVLPSFAAFATPEVVAKMIDMRTLDGCKDTTFESRAMFEVVGRALNMKLVDIAKRILDVDKQKLDVGPKGPGLRKHARRKDNNVNGFNAIASRIRMTVVDIRKKDNIVDGCNVDGCNDVASGIRMLGARGTVKGYGRLEAGYITRSSRPGDDRS